MEEYSKAERWKKRNRHSHEPTVSQKSSHTVYVKRPLYKYFEAYAGVVAYILLAEWHSDGDDTCRKGQGKQHHDEEIEDQEKRKALENQLDA